MDARFELIKKYRITCEKNGDETCRVTYQGDFFIEDSQLIKPGKIVYPRVANIIMDGNYVELNYGGNFINAVGGKVLPDENRQMYYVIMEGENENEI